MELTSYATSPLSLLAPILAIGLVVVTRRVLLSLGAGIVLGALLLQDFDPLAAAQGLLDRLIGVFWSLPEQAGDGIGTLNEWNVYILLFLLLLGAMVGLVTLSGGTRAFGEWARERITSRRGSQLATALLGVFIFIDDYFNSLAVGNICRPLTDRQRVSRAKLAYLIDSTAAPICVLMPISSWGAYIISLIAGILATHSVTGISAFGAFIELAALNFYAIAALVLAFVAAGFDLNIGAMRRHAAMAREGQVFDASRGQPPGNSRVHEARSGRPLDLIAPIVVLILATFAMIVLTGAWALDDQGQPFSLLGAFENTDVAGSLIAGGLFGLGIALLMLLRHASVAGAIPRTLLEGARSMLPAVQILILAWVLTGIINELGTGEYLASLVDGVLTPAWLPALLFVIAGVMAFATGTSWGTFGIMLPIAGDIAAATDLAMLLPMMGAVLAGSVFGDHCSPLSDTTILSSTGAACHHIDHVLTQLPYALLGAAAALLGYLAIGLSGSTALSLMVTLGSLAALIAWLLASRRRAAPETPREQPMG